MSSPRPPLLAFNGGEIGPRTLARTDMDIYPRCAEEMFNILPDVQGGMFKSPGTILVSETEGVGILRDFTFSVSDNVLLEFRDLSVRIFSQDAALAFVSAAATLGAWSDESAAPETGGGSAPAPGTNDFIIGPSGNYEIEP